MKIDGKLGGTGTVFRDKKLKALVIRGPKMGPNLNNADDLPAVIKVGKIINQEIHDHDDEQCHMRRQGTAHLVEVMDADPMMWLGVLESEIGYLMARTRVEAERRKAAREEMK